VERHDRAGKARQGKDCTSVYRKLLGNFVLDVDRLTWRGHGMEETNEGRCVEGLPVKGRPQRGRLLPFRRPQKAQGCSLV
jgi:hypothetical protein